MTTIPFGATTTAAEVVAGIDIDAAVELNQLPCSRLVMAASLIEGFADEV